MTQDEKLDLILDKLESLEEGQEKLNEKVDKLQDETELISRSLNNHTHEIEVKEAKIAN